MTNDDNPDSAHEDPRLTALDKGLKSHAAMENGSKGDKPSAQDESTRRGANDVLAQLIGAPLGGGIIGWVIDHFAHTSPVGLLVMLFLGFAVAIWNVYKLAQRQSAD